MSRVVRESHTIELILAAYKEKAHPDVSFRRGATIQWDQTLNLRCVSTAAIGMGCLGRTSASRVIIPGQGFELS